MYFGIMLFAIPDRLVLIDYYWLPSVTIYLTKGEAKASRFVAHALLRRTSAKVRLRSPFLIHTHVGKGEAAVSFFTSHTYRQR